MAAGATVYQLRGEAAGIMRWLGRACAASVVQALALAGTWWQPCTLCCSTSRSLIAHVYSFRVGMQLTCWCVGWVSEQSFQACIQTTYLFNACWAVLTCILRRDIQDMTSNRTISRQTQAP